MKTLETRGAVLRYVREGSGVPVILVQGVGVIGEGWRPQIAALRDRYSLVAPDNRGIGGSTLGSGTLTIEDMAADVLAIANAEGFERFHLAGHSVGGLIAQEVAQRAPGRVRSLALLCTFLHGKEAARLTPDIMWAGLRTRLGTRAMRRRAFMQLVMPDSYLRTAAPTLAADLAVLFGHDLADQPPIVMKQLRAASRYDASARLSALAHIPTLVVERHARSHRAAEIRPRAGRGDPRRTLRRDSGRRTRMHDPVRNSTSTRCWPSTSRLPLQLGELLSARSRPGLKTRPNCELIRRVVAPSCPREAQP